MNENAQALIVGVRNERLAIALSSVIAIEKVELSDINVVVCTKDDSLICGVGNKDEELISIFNLGLLA
jgi:chemotaxis protein histidine kinase CheA